MIYPYKILKLHFETQPPPVEGLGGNVIKLRFFLRAEKPNLFTSLRSVTKVQPKAKRSDTLGC